MEIIREFIKTMVINIVDDADSVEVAQIQSKNGDLYEVRVSKSDIGKIIGKQGRIANAIRALAKAAGAKAKTRVMVNVLNTSME